MMCKKQKKNSLFLLLPFLLALILCAGCENKNDVSDELSNEEVSEQGTERQQTKETSEKSIAEENNIQSGTDYSIDIDVKDYPIGMIIPTVNCSEKKVDEEMLAPYLSIVYDNTFEYLKIQENDILAFTSVNEDGRSVEVMSNNSIKMKLLYVNDSNEIDNFFGSPLEHANRIISQLGYVNQVELFQVNKIPTSYDNYKIRSAEPLYEIEYVYSPKCNDLYFSCQPGGNNILVQCNNECAFKVIDSFSANFENISEVMINYGYKESVGIIEGIEGYGFNKDEILYCIFVYSNVFSDVRTEYTPVWEFGFKETVIQIDAVYGEIYDYHPTR